MTNRVIKTVKAMRAKAAPQVQFTLWTMLWMTAQAAVLFGTIGALGTPGIFVAFSSTCGAGVGRLIAANIGTGAMVVLSTIACAMIGGVLGIDLGQASPIIGAFWGMLFGCGWHVILTSMSLGRATAMDRATGPALPATGNSTERATIRGRWAWLVAPIIAVAAGTLIGAVLFVVCLFTEHPMDTTYEGSRVFILSTVVGVLAGAACAIANGITALRRPQRNDEGASNPASNSSPNEFTIGDPEGQP